MPQRVWIGRLSTRTRERDVEDFFRSYGKISDIILKPGYAFVEFEHTRDAEDAVHDLSKSSFMGERVTLELARGTPRGRDAYGWRPSEHDRNSAGTRGRPDRSDFRVLIKNLSTRIAWPELKEMFRKEGYDVVYCDAHTRKEREGLVEFARKSDMRKAIDRMNGREINGREIELEEDEYTKERRHTDGRKRSSRSRSRKRGSGSRSRSRDKRSVNSGSSGSRSRSRSGSADSKTSKVSKAPSKAASEKEKEKAWPEKETTASVWG